MFERFTKRARQVVEGAMAHAASATASEVRPEHLLAAILDDESCLATHVLTDAGAPADQVRVVLDRQRRQYVDWLDADDAAALQAIGIDLDEVVRRIDRNLGGSPPSRGKARFSRSSKKVLELALREAIALRHGYIGTEHLLLGLVRGEDRVIVDTLGSFGIERGALRESVAAAVRRSDEQTG